MTGAPAPQPSSASERKKLIAEYEDAKRSEADRFSSEQAQALRRRQLVRPVTLTIIMLVLTFLAITPPAWILPPPVPAPTAAERNASIRFAIYLQAQQLERFRGARGRLPTDMTEVGEPLPGIRYDLASPTTYILRSTTDSSIRYHSSESLSAFVGNSMTLLGPPQ
jgi:hypothetical protein